MTKMTAGEQIIKSCAALRGQGKFQEAIALVEANSANLDDSSRVPALLQAFYAARDGGFKQKARELAHKVAAEDPDVPTIQDYLL